MKMSKFRLTFIVLLIATIVWGIAFYYTRARARLRTRWYLWNGGIYIVVSGWFLFLAWFGFFGYLLSEKVYPHFKHRLSKMKKPTVNPLEACSPPSPKRRAEREQKIRKIKMGKILSNIMALAVLIVGILFCLLLYLVMVFFLIVLFTIGKINTWLAIPISFAIVLTVGIAYGCLAKKLGVKMEL